jgi:predicted branched-subunit amino acid permease
MTATTPVDTSCATSTWELARNGVRDMTPMAVGIIPFGLAVGATIAASDVGIWVGLASAPMILAGAAQLATLQMLDEGSSPAVIVVSALLINLRIPLYGASLAPWFRGVRLRTRLLLATAVIDQTHFVCEPRFEAGDLDRRGRVAYYSGAGGWLIAVWLGSQVAAVVVGAELPESARLDMAAPLALVGLLAKSVGSRPSALAALVGTVVVTVGAGLPFHTAALVATLVAIAAAVVVDRRTMGQVAS